MNFNQTALIRAIAIGAGVGAVAAILRNIPLVGIACCCLGWVLYLAVGAAYGYFDQQQGNPSNTGTYALGGAISGAVAGLVWGIVSGLVGLLLGLLGVTAQATAQAFQQLEQAGVDMPPGILEQMAFTTGGGVIGIFTSACWGLVFYAILGAVGGLLYALIRGNQTPTMATPAV